MLASISARNLGRNLRRTLITASTLFFGFVMSVFFGAFYDGMHAEMIDHGTRLLVGHLLVRGAGAELGPSPLDPGPVIAAAERLKRRPRHALRASGEGIVEAAGRSAPVSFIGLAPELERDQSKLLELTAEGRPVSADAPDGAVLGERLAATLHLRLGDPFRLFTELDGDQLGERRLEVRGLMKSGIEEIDGHGLELPLASAQAILALGSKVTEVPLFFEDEGAGRSARPALAAMLASEGVEVLSWNQALPSLAAVVEMDDAGLSIFLGIVYLIMGLGVLNTVLMGVMERLREFGVLLALGASRAQIVWLVLAETAALTALSLGAGLLLVLPLNHWLAVAGLDLSAMLPPGYQLGGVALGPRIHFITRPERVATVAAMIFAMAQLAALLPALRAARIEPVEVLKGVAR
jgi:ABC-type lipoprotein release transport system permease subunit